MTTQILITLLIFLSEFFCYGQTRVSMFQEDSICKYGKKYNAPVRLDFPFPAKEVTNEYKIKELHKAIPDSLSNEENKDWWYYNYYFMAKIYDYDPKGDSIFNPQGDKLLYKLKDTYFFDVNGDGLLDFIHYPIYYMAIMRNIDAYEIFIQAKEGYKWLTFRGFITNIEYNKDGTLNKMITFKGRCCDDHYSTYYYYTFDKVTNELILTSREDILTCQLKKN